jgi:hypothetical protein
MFWGFPYGGTVLKTSLSNEDEKELQDALHGDETGCPVGVPEVHPSAELLRIRGPYPIAAGVKAYQDHLRCRRTQPVCAPGSAGGRTR